MRRIFTVIGQAGTGKTYWLTEKVNEIGAVLLTRDHHTLLAITRMHGSRRRLVAKLREKCPSLQCKVTTIDGFALSILNRWRTALGYGRPIQPSSSDAAFCDSAFGVDAGFTAIVEAATRLLSSATVSAVIRESYPLVMVDEFQDCHGALLEFVIALSRCSSLLLAGDDFQLLDSAIDGCPAVEWAKTQAARGAGTVEELKEPRRTSDAGILAAASSLRQNMAATRRTVPVISCPTHQAAAWKIIDPLVLGWYSPRWGGTSAVISPTQDSFLNKVLSSANDQLGKRKRNTLRWNIEASEAKQKEDVAARLGLTAAAIDSDAEWQRPTVPLDKLCTHVVTRVKRFAHLRGIQAIRCRLVSRHVDIAVHSQRAYWSSPPGTTVTTVHGAKNREFDSVFVLWNPFSVSRWSTVDQRRLLYNAITRSKSNCAVLVLATEERIRNDPVLRLLGPPDPAFPRRTRSHGQKVRRVKKKRG